MEKNFTSYGRFSLTLNVLNGPDKAPHVAAVVSFIDESFKPNHKLVVLEDLDQDLTAEKMINTLTQSLGAYPSLAPNTIQSISLDTAPLNSALMAEFNARLKRNSGVEFKNIIKCCSNIIDLVANDILSYISNHFGKDNAGGNGQSKLGLNIVGRVRTLAKLVNNNVEVKHRFATASIPGKSVFTTEIGEQISAIKELEKNGSLATIPVDDEAQWESTLCMLQCVLKYKDELSIVSMMSPNYEFKAKFLLASV